MTAPTVSLDVHDGVARLTLDSPPVNALGKALRTDLSAALAALADTPEVTAVLLIGTPRAFSAGADITEFDAAGADRAGPGDAGTPGRVDGPPSLPELVNQVENFPKPVIAAITGVALGGGLELAMAAHARTAHPGARLGLPEITLGLLPGAGGTGRLPRLVGPERALEMILGGQQISAATALQDGLVDAVLDATDAVGFEREAIRWTADFAARPASGDAGSGDAGSTDVRSTDAGSGDGANPGAVRGNAPVRTRDRTDIISAAAALPGTVAKLAAGPLRKAGDPFAARAAVDAVTAGIEESFERGAEVERAKFLARKNSPESAAQRHLFGAERASRKPADLEPDAAREVGSAGVVGAGTMGGGIALALATAGISVTIVETGQEALDRGLAQLQKNLDVSVSHGSRTREQAAAQRNLVTGSLDYADLRGADLVIEAAFEDLDVKKEIFATLDRHLADDAILATNTSYLDVNEIAAATRHPGRVLGMHFFSPANVMPLVEVVRGRETGPAALATGFAAARRIGKTPVVVGVCHGFVGNRMLEVRSRQAEQLLLDGALPAQVDAALTGFGFRMGPFAMGDMAGLDIGWRNRKAQGTSAPIGDALCEAGRFGQKTGAGYYAYEGRERRDDPEVARIIERVSAGHGITRRNIEEQEILERLLFPMINEGARILEEGIAERAGDIDVIWVKGYNWPAYRGGPMWYADHIGAGTIVGRLRHYAELTGDDTLLPARILAEAADAGTPVGGIKA